MAIRPTTVRRAVGAELAGYAKPDSPLVLTLVFNPTGPSLPPDQRRLEATYRQELLAPYEIEFTRLFTITNMPIVDFATIYCNGVNTKPTCAS